jgi:DNA-binding SARP family transcriptional activator
VRQAGFHILGSIEAVRDVKLGLGPPKQRAFLALLLVRLNRVVSRAQLGDERWPEDPPATAVKALQVFA